MHWTGEGIDCVCSAATTWMAQQLRDHDQQDDRLTDVARIHHRTVAYWCGRRQEGAKALIWCYVCDNLIVTYASRWPMTAAARERILRHRAEELARLGTSHHGLQETTA